MGRNGESIRRLRRCSQIVIRPGRRPTQPGNGAMSFICAICAICGSDASAVLTRIADEPQISQIFADCYPSRSRAYAAGEWWDVVHLRNLRNLWTRAVGSSHEPRMIHRFRRCTQIETSSSASRTGAGMDACGSSAEICAICGFMSSFSKIWESAVPHLRAILARTRPHVTRSGLPAAPVRSTFRVPAHPSGDH
jgi:hypothetical protein